MGLELRYAILLPPVTKKNSQRILKSAKTGKPFIMPSEQSSQYAHDAAWFLKPRPSTPIAEPVSVKCLFYMKTRRRVDLVNLLEAADDLLVSAGILADDNSQIIAAHDGSRVLFDKENPRTEITITGMEAGDD